MLERRDAAQPAMSRLARLINRVIWTLSRVGVATGSMYQPYLIRSQRPRFEATSPGERLWFALRDWWYDSLGDQVGPKGLAGFAWLDGEGRPGQALTHFAISDACTRLARRADKLLTLSMGEGAVAEQFRDTVVSEIKQYCVMPMGMGFSDPALPIFANLAFDCAKAGRQLIAPTTRRNIDRETRVRANEVACYVCGIGLSKGYPIDHIWPRSLGGVSGEENLLPICEPCNTRKKDRIGWDVFGVVFDHAFMGQTEEGSRLAEMALQRRAATALAERNAFTLKEAFVLLGPVGIRERIDSDIDDPWFFNNTVHDQIVLPHLWAS